MGFTLAEKIIMKNTGRQTIEPGEIVVVHPSWVMIIDSYTRYVYRKFYEMGFKKVWDPSKVVYIHDHFIPCGNEGDVLLQHYGEKFVEEQGIEHFHRSEGICHQLMPEYRYALPGEIAIVTDSHTTTYGAVSNLGIGIGYTEMAGLLGTGELWLKVPETIRIQIDGNLPAGVMSKDIILRILGDIKADGGNYKSIEFTGTTISQLSIDSRLTISNMVVECGGKAGLFPADEKTAEYSGQSYENIRWLYGDDDANYVQKLYYRAEEFVPSVACPCYVDNVKPVQEIIGTKIDQVFIGSCTNGRLEDLEIAARILKGKKIAPYMKLIVTPASRNIFHEAIRKGYIQALVEAGAMILQTGCTLCVGTNYGLLSAGQAVLGTHNRNFLGRMGSSEADIYLGSPATAAVTALNGHISDPRECAAIS